MRDVIGARLSQIHESLGSGILSQATGISESDLSPIEECVHFWLIESPNGPTSQGTCKHCGKAQLFRNSVSRSTWNRGVAKREDAWL